MISAEMSGIGEYIGAVQGTLNAVEDPRFQGNFVGTLMGKVRKKFMTEAVAANLSGAANLHHVFEWGDQDADGVATGRPSAIPLFKLTKNGRGDNRFLSYDFLPSTKPVPLPDPAKYGFKPEILGHLRRHVFYMKALIMETQTSVVVSPRYSKRGLFIPTTRNEKGYTMYPGSVQINPGGGTTGQFAAFWAMWFESRAQDIVNDETKKAEEVIAATGQKVIRYAAGTRINGQAVGGRFASGKGVSFGFVDAETRNAQQMASAELNKYYDEDEEWDEEW